MAVQLILKNSAVQDKEATAAQLATGELALNYYESGPFLQCKDTAGNIWRLGGVVIASTAPSSPSKGAWWLDSDDNHLYFYNGSSWVEVQTGEITASDIAEGTARQLLQTNAAGTATEWTSNIDVPGTLDVTGVATFDNNVVIEGNLTVNGTTTTIDTETLLVEDKNIEMGVVTTPTDTTADGGGITLKGATDKTINWVNATDAWTSSERFDFPAGTAAAPSIILNGDVNSGLYQPGADQVAISTGGTGRLFVDASGRVGVGTTSPGAKCDIAGGSDATLRIYNTLNNTPSGSHLELLNNSSDGLKFSVGRSGAGGNSNLTYDNAFNINAGATGAATFDSSGRLGLGTSSPQTKFDIQSSYAFDTAAQDVIKLTPSLSGSPTYGVATSIGSILWGYSSGTNLGRINVVSRNPSVSNSSSMQFWIHNGTSFEQKAVLNSTGLGVGTTSPSYDLQIKANTPQLALQPTADTQEAQILFRNAADNASAGTIVYDHGNSFLKVNVNNSERLRIDSSGRVGIGTSAPNELLQVGSRTGSPNGKIEIAAENGADGNDYQFLKFKQSGNTYGIALSTYRYVSGGRWYNDLRFNTGDSGIATVNPRMTIAAGGNVGIGTTSPGAPLSVQANSTAEGIEILGRATDDIGEFAFFENDGTTEIGRIQARTTELNFRARQSGQSITFISGGITERARIDSSGRLLVGTSSSRGNNFNSASGGDMQLQVEGTDYKTSGASFTSNSTSATYGPHIALNRSRGSTIGSNTLVNNGDLLGAIVFEGSDGSEFVQSANITAYVDGTPGANDMPGRLVFSTTADGASSPTERVRIEATGKTKFSGAAYGVENTITASAFDLNDGNLWTCGAIAIPNPTNAVAGLMGSIRVTAAPTSFGSNFDHPGGSYTAPTSFPAVAPFYCVSSTNILLGSWTQGIA